MNVFKEGDVVGPNGCILIEKKTGNKDKRPMHKFKCGECPNSFYSILAPIKNGMIAGCGCRRLIKYETGQKLGPNNHIFLKDVNKIKHKRVFLFKCSFCNNEFEANVRNILTGNKSSCGCLNIGESFRTDRQKMHSIRNNMLSRCYNKKSPNYHRYGGRGITVCDEWRFENGLNNFIEDMGYVPNKKLNNEKYSIDRIDNNKGYYKENCRWVTNKEQSLNRECSKNTYRGIYYSHDRKVWRIYLMVNGIYKNIGSALNRQYGVFKINDYIRNNNLNLEIRELDNTKLVLITSYEIQQIFENFKDDKCSLKKLNNLLINNDQRILNIFDRLNITNVLYIENVLKDGTIHISYRSDIV